jgi:hypothetical protein
LSIFLTHPFCSLPIHICWIPNTIQVFLSFFYFEQLSFSFKCRRIRLPGCWICVCFNLQEVGAAAASARAGMAPVVVGLITMMASFWALR